MVHLNLTLADLASDERTLAAEYPARSLLLYQELGDRRGLALRLEVAGILLDEAAPQRAA